MQPLKSKTALVTGGSRGIGAAVGALLADQGADVAVSYVASADKANAKVMGEGGRIITIGSGIAIRASFRGAADYAAAKAAVIG